MSLWRRMRNKLDRGELLLWKYLFEGPDSDNSGLFYLSHESILSDLKHYGYDKDEIASGMKKLIDIGFIKYSYEHDVIYIPRMLDKQGGDNSPTVKTHIEQHLECIVDCDVKAMFCNDYGYSLGPTESGKSEIRKAYIDPNPNHNIKKETTDLSPTQKSETPPKPKSTKSSIVGDVTVVGDLIDIPKPKPRTPPHNPWTVELRELQQYYADTWSTQDKHIPINPKPVNGDLKRRMSYALDEYGYKACQGAIRGHHALATTEGSQRGKEIAKAFPEGSKRGRRDSSRLDTEAFFFLVNAAPKSIEEKRKEDKELSKKHTPKSLTDAEHEQRQEQIKRAKAEAFGGKGELHIETN